MTNLKKINLNNILATTIKILVALFIVSPAYILVVYSLKRPREIMLTGLAWPKTFSLENFVRAYQESGIIQALSNTALTVIIAIPIIILFSSMASYGIVRNKKKFYDRLYYVFLAQIVLPFQVIMMPLYKILVALHIMNTRAGYIVAMIGLQTGFSIFLTTGFVKSIPLELEESALIDGANRYTCFFRIVLPLLKPIIITVALLDTLTIWNDLPMAQIICQKSELKTLTLAQYSFIAQYVSDLGLAFAAFIMSIIPMIILYFIAQKNIIGGIVAGAIKG